MKEEHQVEVGHRLRNYRLHLYGSQEAFANKLQISRALLNLVERGRRPLTLKVALRLHRSDGLSLDAIYAGLIRTNKERLMLKPPEGDPQQ